MLDLLHVVKLLLVVLERLRQTRVLRRRSRAVELFLHRLVHLLAVFDPVLLRRIELADTGILVVELVNEELFVLIVLTLVPR